MSIEYVGMRGDLIYHYQQEVRRLRNKVWKLNTETDDLEDALYGDANPYPEKDESPPF